MIQTQIIYCGIGIDGWIHPVNGEEVNLRV